MAYSAIYYETGLPEEVVDVLCKDIKKLDVDREVSTVGFESDDCVVDRGIRNSSHVWVSTDHWIVGFLWHYVMKANRENFLYDLTHIDAETVQYTTYEPGCYYHWHTDSSISSWETPHREHMNDQQRIDNHHVRETEVQRKLSFVLQLSDAFDYEGGQFELLDDCDNRHLAPRKRGTLFIFDSRCKHRVTKVKSGVRQSIVGWVMGPRWR